MRQLRSIGIFAIVGAVLCGLVGYERFQTARKLAERISGSLEGVELVSVGLPIETKVAAVVGTLLLTLGIGCLIGSTRHCEKPPML